MITLALDASTYVATLAVLNDGHVIARAETAMRGADEERLMPAVATLLEAADITPAGLGRIVCGAGPGSFTSLRIAASIAKGLASGANKPLHAISSLALVVAGSDMTRVAGRYVAAVDALRGEHYAATCRVGDEGDIIAVGAVERWPTEALRERAATIGPLVGPGLDLDASPRAAALPRVEQLAAACAVDVASWEPDYGRLAEAQVRWEAVHGRPLPTT